MGFVLDTYMQVTSKPNRQHNNDQTDDYKHKMKR